MLWETGGWYLGHMNIREALLRETAPVFDNYHLLQVVACSFVYGGSKTKNKNGDEPKGDQNAGLQPSESAAPSSVPLGQHFAPISAMGMWPSSRQVDLRNPHTDIDLTRG